jgi:hypothetical protein
MINDEFEKLEEPDWTSWHYEGKHFEAKAVSRGEFEALKRFGDYDKLRETRPFGPGAIRKAVSRSSCATPSALVRIAEALASHFRYRVGGRSALVASEIILSARDPSNPRPCLLWTREAKVS